VESGFSRIHSDCVGLQPEEGILPEIGRRAQGRDDAADELCRFGGTGVAPISVGQASRLSRDRDRVTFTAETQRTQRRFLWIYALRVLGASAFNPGQPLSPTGQFLNERPP
jgi:hypothetical protein